MNVLVNEDVGIIGLLWRREVLFLEKMILRRSLFMIILSTAEKFLCSTQLICHVLMLGSQSDPHISQLR